MPICFYLIN